MLKVGQSYQGTFVGANKPDTCSYTVIAGNIPGKHPFLIKVTGKLLEFLLLFDSNGLSSNGGVQLIIPEPVKYKAGKWYTDKSNRACKCIYLEDGEAIFKVYCNSRNYYFNVSNNEYFLVAKKEVSEDNPVNSLSHISEGTERDTREQRLAETLDKTQEAFELD